MLTEAQKSKAEKRLSEYLLEHYGTTIKDTSDKQMYRMDTEKASHALLQKSALLRTSGRRIRTLQGVQKRTPPGSPEYGYRLPADKESLSKPDWIYRNPL